MGPRNGALNHVQAIRLAHGNVTGTIKLDTVGQATMHTHPSPAGFKDFKPRNPTRPLLFPLGAAIGLSVSSLPNDFSARKNGTVQNTE